MEVTRIFDILDKYRTELPGKKDVFAQKINGEWVKYSTKDYVEMADNFSYGLYQMGLRKGDKIATVSNNRPEWNFADMGMGQLGVVHVPIYPTISDEDYKHILAHSEAKLLIVSDESLYQRLLPIVASIDSIEDVYTFNKIPKAKNWMEIVELGKTGQDFKVRGAVTNIRNSVKPDDLATIIYTSGTTGLSKGVMLSHTNFIYQVHKIKKLINLKEKHRALSFLPLCHVLERIGGYTFQFLGMSIYYAESIEKIAEDIKEVKPHAFITVPRLLERIYDKIVQKGKDLDGWKRELFFWSVNKGLEYELNFKKGILYETQLAVANRLIFSKWREAMGGKLRLVISGGAALQPRLARVFWAAGIPVVEGYGLTETAPVIAVNRPKYPDIKFGTVGPLLGEEQEVKIAEDGEILFKGPNLMMGYYKDEQKTKEAIDADGWFHTGDIGLFEEDRFLKITDRKKEIFKLSTGKYIAPQVIENILKESFFIEQAMVVGDNEKYAGALISPNFEFLHDWAAQKRLHYRDNRDLIELNAVVERYEEEVERLNKRLGKTDKIKRFQLVCEEWTPDNGELSPTLKLKRRFIQKKYQWRIDQVYGRYDESPELKL